MNLLNKLRFSLISGSYIDEYGFRITVADESLGVYYMAGISKSKDNVNCAVFSGRLNDHYEERLEKNILHRSIHNVLATSYILIITGSVGPRS